MKQYVSQIVSGLMLTIGLVVGWIGVQVPWQVSLLWYGIAVIPVGWPVVMEMVETMRNGEIFSEFFLMVAAALCAFIIGEYPEGVAVLLFYSVGEGLQDRAVDKANDNIKALLDVRSDMALVQRGDVAIEVPSAEVAVGEVLVVRAGARVPIDGLLLTDSAAFDTSAITGESAPRMIEKGENVLSGMLAADAEVQVRTTKPFGESTMSRILDMVQNASERKSPTELFIRKFSGVYTMFAMLMAASIILLPLLASLAGWIDVYDWHKWLSRAAVFMVIACPCALVVSIPLGYFGGIGTASRHGILVKGGNYLDALAKVSAVAFDKTGTLTQGEFGLEEVLPADATNADALLVMAASVEAHSSHPMAKAICRYAAQRGVILSDATSVTEVAGHGLQAEVDASQVLTGNAKLLAAHGVEMPASVVALTGAVVYVAVNGAYAGCLRLSDCPKPDAAKAVASLARLGVTRVQLLSGDRQGNVDELARKIGISQAFGDLLPEDKVAHVDALRQQASVAFVGDGINDAPVLALADVGIAMGAMGSDAAIETADVVIEDDNPLKVATAISIARSTRRVVWQNVVMALGIKLAVMVLGLLGIANMWMGVFADSGVALLAVLNAIRIQRHKF